MNVRELQEIVTGSYLLSRSISLIFSHIEFLNLIFKIFISESIINKFLNAKIRFHLIDWHIFYNYQVFILYFPRNLKNVNPGTISLYLVFFYRNHFEVASDPFCLLINSSYIYILSLIFYIIYICQSIYFILQVFNLEFLFPY